MLLLFSHLLMSNSLQPHGLQHARPPCPSPLPEVMSFASVMPFSHLILWSPLLFLPSFFPSIRDSDNESAVCIRWPKYWSFSFSISPSNEDSGLISLKIDWFDLLAVQKTLRSLLQHHSLKASMLWHSVFFTVQFSQLYVTTGETTALTLWTLVSRLMSAFQHTVYVCHSFPAKKQLSSDFMAAVTICSDFRAQEEQISHYFHFSPSICHEVMEPGYHDLSFLFNI